MSQEIKISRQALSLKKTIISAKSLPEEKQRVAQTGDKWSPISIGGRGESTRRDSNEKADFDYE